MERAVIDPAASEAPPSERPVTRDMIECARTELASGEGVEHSVVSAWLRTLGKPGLRPFKEWLAAWNG